jgi:predicted TIM-barrel fold metal-dependent hydrolase
MEPLPLHHVWQYTDVDRAFWREHLESWVPPEIFDAHTHVQDPAFRLAPMTEEMRRQYWVNEVCEPIAAADAQRCQQLVYPGRRVQCLVFGMPDLDYDIEASNRQLSAECVRRGWHSLAVIRPEWSAERLRQELDRPTVLGAKVYYALLGHDPATRDAHLEASIFDFLPRRHLEVLSDRRAWVTLHVPRAGRLGDARNIAEIKEIRRAFPRVVLVIAHLGRCYTLPHAEEAFPTLVDDEGLYFDNSAVLNPAVHRLAIETFGPRRILYGTDNPIFYMRGRRSWRGRTYINHTSYPFHFNRDREPPEVEAGYTLYMYEALRAIRQACDDLSLDRGQVAAILHDNAAGLVAAVQAASSPRRGEGM